VTSRGRPAAATRLCFFSHSAGLGGAQRSLLELVSELIAEHGCRCLVVLPRAGPLRENLRRAGAECARAPFTWWCDVAPVAESEALLRMKESILALGGETLERIARFDPHVVVTSTMVIPWGAVTASRLGKPHLWMVSEYGESDHGLRFFLPFAEILRIIRCASTAILTNSRDLRRALFPELSDERCIVLHRHISIPPPQSAAAPSRHFFRLGAVRLGLFATLCPGKGQDDAVRAVAELVARGHDVELLLAGQSQPAFRDRLERLAREHAIAERVRFPGFLHDVYPAMREADMVVVCSRHEAFGRVAVEALLLDKPVVYPACGGFLDSMIDGETGLSYPPGDVGALVDRIATFIEDPALGCELAARGKRHVQARFPRREFGGKFLGIVERLRATSPAPLPNRFPRQLLAAIDDPSERMREAGDLLVRRYAAVRARRARGADASG
jgi:glycosyltransferase involved in cell wall biosynthesis